MSSIDRWVHYWADHLGNRPAIVEGDRTVSYRDLSQSILTTTAWLAGVGVGRGDRVGFCALNRAEQISTLFACARLGAILLPLNNRLSAGELAYQLADAEPRVVFVGDGFQETLAAIGSDAETNNMQLVDLDHWQPSPTAIGDAPKASGVGDDPVLMVYTSGTTGNPKGAIHTQSSLLHTILNAVAHQDLDADDVILTSLPLFHVGGLNIQTLPALYVGATVHLQRAFDPGDALEIIARHRPTQTLQVPATMTALLAHPAIADTDLSCLRGMNSGSSVVPAHLIDGFVELGVPVGQVYGATETGPTAIVLRYDDADRIGSCGKPALHTELRIVDGDGVDVAPGRAGEVWLRGPNIFAGYWRNDEATEQAFAGDWYRTGDVGHRDGDGFVHIEDRLKDMLISGGENVYPAEVENILMAHPALAEVAVIGRADEKWGEVPVAVVVVEDGMEAPSITELRAWCESRLARYKQPSDIVAVESLPRTALGKVTKHLLRDQVLGGGS